MQQANTIKANTMSQAFIGGRNTWLIIKNQPAGVQRKHSNPYAMGSQEWHDWERGFMTAD